MNLPFESIDVRYFRGVESCLLENLGQFNLLVGKNDSGKTTVLEAINILVNPLNIAEWVKLARRRELKPTKNSLLQSLRWLFPHVKSDTDNKSSIISVYCDGFYDVRRLSSFYLKTSKIDDTNTNDVVINGCGISIDVEIQPDLPPYPEEVLNAYIKVWENETTEFNDFDSPFSLPVQFISPFSHRIEQLQIKALTDSTLGGFKSEVVNVLQALDPQIKDIEILSKDGLSPSIYIQHLQTGMTPLSMFGDGIRKALTLALAIIPAANGVLLLDEMETSLHTSALQDLFKWLLAVAKQYYPQSRSCRCHFKGQ
jgi:energy-coupling factor transporter ATP-binding protein EcfA2